VRFLIVGGEAVIYYGYPRFTGDLDIFYDNSPESVRKIQSALEEFWGGAIPDVKIPDDFLEPGMIIQFGVPPNRIDMMNRIDGVAFEEAWSNKIYETIQHSSGRFKVYYIGKNELIKNKRACGRYKDLEDLKYLE
jgi:hypothetical protein